MKASEGLLEDLKPSDVGLDQYPSFRAIQLEAAELVSMNERRFTGLCAPTGSGKTGMAALIHRLTGWRTAVLTMTKGLQKTYETEFANIGIRDIKGKQNYPCGVYKTNCADGSRLGCDSIGCGSEEAKVGVRNANIFVTNYAMWLSYLDHGGSFGRLVGEGEPNPVECLILDEAHEADRALSDFLGVRLYEKELIEVLGWEDAGELKESMGLWVQAAQVWFREADLQLQNMNRVLKAKGHGSKAELSHASRLESLYKKLERIKGIGPKDEEWVLEGHESAKWGKSWNFDVVWPGRYAESKLFRGVQHVVLMSATLREKTMGLLGIPKDQYEFKEWRRVFPAQRGPVFHLPPRKEVDGEVKAININRKVSEGDLKIWMETIDQFITEWKEFKGVIHTVSYERQRYIMENSIHSKLMLGNTSDPDSDTAWEVFERFKRLSAPAVLVSPSFGTGWDFKGELARWQVIAKVPFPPMVGKVMRARLERDKSYADYIAIQALMQDVGRIQRSEEDWGVSVIIDGALSFLMMRSGGLAPQWFKSGIRRVVDVPDKSLVKSFS